ncbi:MAG: sulfite exporter TauE/SafE family protein [Melioribacteraceae bacterium]|nr:sulfite exporter TauE/SafE family protein [Melioribacteraceae bacterium]
MDLTTYILIGIVIFTASFVQGFGGFGFALVSIPLLSLIVDIKYAIPLGALCGLFINFLLLFELKSHIRFFELKRLVISAVIGIPIGVVLLSQAPASILKSILAVFVILFVILSFTKILPQKSLNKNWGYLFGLLSGLFGGAFNTNGPPVLVYFYLQGWDKNKQKASLTGFFTFTSVTIVLSHIAFGISTIQIAIDFLYMIPSILAGNYIGTHLFKKISTKNYNRLILISLLILSFLLLFRT